MQSSSCSIFCLLQKHGNTQKQRQTEHWFRNFGVQESMRPFQSIKVLNTYSKAQRNQWESGHWIQQALECTHAGREHSPAQPDVGNSELTAASFGGIIPLLTAAWELQGEQWRGAKRGHPALEIITSGTAQHWSNSALLDPFFLSFIWALCKQMGNTLHPRPEGLSMQGGQWHQNATTWKNQGDLSTLIGEPFLLVIFWLFVPI